MWAVYAGLSALFASLTAILGKIGVQGINSNLATAIRTIFVLVMAWGMVFITGAQAGMKDIGGRSLVFLMLSGLATGASWLCYYKALQVGQVAKVVTIDKFSLILTFFGRAFPGKSSRSKRCWAACSSPPARSLWRCDHTDKEYKWKRILTALSSAQAQRGFRRR
ncbi:MAG: EamA family transporter [Ruthenibacterium lactatiformans]